jgi:hypothetical protein
LLNLNLIRTELFLIEDLLTSEQDQAQLVFLRITNRFHPKILSDLRVPRSRLLFFSASRLYLLLFHILAYDPFELSQLMEMTDFILHFVETPRT